MRKAVIRAGLETLYVSGTHRVARPFLGGLGAILMFHRVRPPRAGAFQPNRHLEISPDFLDEVVGGLIGHGIDIVSMDEARRRLTEGRSARRFAVLTFDDGYRDNLTYAWPILQRLRAPFVVYVAAAFADGRGELWWQAIEEAIARRERLTAVIDGAERVFDCATLAAKTATWRMLHAWLMARPDEAELRTAVRAISSLNGVDMTAGCREACMTWDELAALARHDLVTIGAHTVSHPILGKLGEDDARAEMVEGSRRIDATLGTRPRHFAYPVGSRAAAGPREFGLAAAAGFETAVTTRPGVLFPDHAAHLTALPRISVNGEFQRLRYLDVLLSGAATALMNGFRRVDAA